MDNKKQIVEDLGVQFEKTGRSPMVARVFAFLLISDPPEKSFDEIIEFLGASKSAISNSLKALQDEGLVTYITKSGIRKRFFIIDVKNWKSRLIESSKDFNNYNKLLENVIENRKNAKSKNFTESIEEILEFQMFLGEKLAEIIEEWKAR
jgi:DNA-binding transcriptional regulator GbsR (MarR family)